MLYITVIILFICIMYIAIRHISKLDKYNINEFISEKTGINKDTIDLFDCKEVSDKIYMRANFYWIEDSHWKYQDKHGNRIDIDENEMIQTTAYLILDIDNKTYELSTKNAGLLEKLVNILNSKGYNITEKVGRRKC